MADEADICAERKLQRRRLLEQLAMSPVKDIVGVVAPSGFSGGKLRGEMHLTLRFTLEAWRIDAGDVQIRPITIRREVTDEEFNWLRDQIKPYAVIRITARVDADSLLGSPQGLFEALVGIDTSDHELNNFAEQLQKPVTHDDPVLGIFTLDRRIDWFRGNVVWDGNPVSLNLAAREPAEIEEALRTAHALWESQKTWNRRVRDYAVQKLLPLKNGGWCDDNEAELSADQFNDRMTLESITVYADRSFEFWYNDGDLFWGHSIKVRGNLQDGLTHAGIAG